MRRSRDVGLLGALCLLVGFVWGTLAAPRVRPQSVAVAGADGRVVVIQLYDDQSWEYAGGVVATPSPDATHTPSVTPSASPTVTVTHTATAAPETPTPTQEVTVAPVTPAPTLPPPDADLCKVGVVTSALNVRADHSTSSAVVGKLTQSQRVEIDSLYIVHPEGDPQRTEWGYIPNGGWIALWYGGDELARLDDSAPCWELPIERVTAFGVWVGPGADRAELVQFGQTLKAAGMTPAATVYGDPYTATMLALAGWVVAARPWIGDCPPASPDPVASAQAWVDRALEDLRGVRFTWLSLTNECAWPSAQYAAAWIAAAVQSAAEQGVKRVIPAVWNSGAPELDWMKTLAPAYVHAPIDVCFGVNIYPVDDLPLSSHDGLAPWTTWRFRQLRAWIPGVPICATEAARSDGTQPAQMEDLTTWAYQVDGEFAFATFWYDAVELGHWGRANLRGRLAELVGLVGGNPTSRGVAHLNVEPKTAEFTSRTLRRECIG